MKSDNINNYQYRMVVYPIIEGSNIEWVAEVPDLNGCIGCGETESEAIEIAKEAINSWIEIAIKDGEKIPESTNPYNTEYSGKFTLRLLKSVHKDLVVRAEEEGVSINQIVNNYIIKCLYGVSDENKESKYLTEEIIIRKNIISGVKSDWLEPIGENLINNWRDGYGKIKENRSTLNRQ